MNYRILSWSFDIVTLAVQCLALLVAIFGDIGFDHPGRYGLDFTAGVVIACVYIVALIVGLLIQFFRLISPIKDIGKFRARLIACGLIVVQLVVPIYMVFKGPFF